MEAPAPLPPRAGPRTLHCVPGSASGTPRAVEAQWLQNPIFAAAGAAACQRLAGAHAVRRYEPGEVLLRMGDLADQVLVVLQGAVRLYQSSADGREVVVKLMRAPCILGDLEFFAGVEMIKNVEVVAEVQVAAMPGRRYMDFLVAHPPAMLEHTRQVAAAFCVAGRNQRQVLVNLEQRVANFLLAFAELCEVDGEPGLALSQDRIARSVGSVRRSVARVLSAWARKGVVTCADGRYLIHQREQLVALAAPLSGGLLFQMGKPLEGLSLQEPLHDAEVEVLCGPGSLPGRRHAVEDELLVGRMIRCGLRLPDEYVSMRHCRIFRATTGRRFWIEDLHSDNGTRVNGEPVLRAVLRDGDVIQVGAIRLGFNLRDEPARRPAPGDYV